jgi:DnaJ homolog subfamily B member 6
MEDSDNPYDILGVSPNASASEIKTAYRKLALRHHPDRQTNESAKATSGPIFAKISNAYEILGDDRRREEFDQQQQRREGMRSNAFNDHSFHFHDPFEVFAQTFAREFGTQQRGTSGGGGFHDPFFGSPFGGGLFGGMFGRQNGFQDPFSDSFFEDPFSHRSMGGHMDVFSQMQQQMDMMRQQTPSSSSSQFYSSSSSSSFRGEGSQRESVSTTTRIINGKRQTITERVITKPDGTVERHVETVGDPDFPAQLEHGRSDNGSGSRPLLEEKPKRQKTKKFFR